MSVGLSVSKSHLGQRVCVCVCGGEVALVVLEVLESPVKAGKWC